MKPTLITQDVIDELHRQGYSIVSTADLVQWTNLLQSFTINTLTYADPSAETIHCLIRMGRISATQSTTHQTTTYAFTGHPDRTLVVPTENAHSAETLKLIERQLHA
jgi:hypothetical protein